MPKNFQIHLRIETPITDQLKRQALEEGISFGELCRRKLKKTPQLERIESLLIEIDKKLKCSTKLTQEV